MSAKFGPEPVETDQFWIDTDSAVFGTAPILAERNPKLVETTLILRDMEALKAPVLVEHVNN